jgi:indole-3-acetate monooxygenase
VTHAVVDAAAALGATIRAEAPDAERERHLSAAVVAGLRDAGLFRMNVPRAYGGPEVPLVEQLAAIEEVASHDGAAGWCTMIASTTSVLSLVMDPEAAKTIYSGHETATGGAYAPTGTAVVDDSTGEYVVDGRWMWGSGTDHCEWICGGAIAGGDLRLLWFPREQVEFHDTWHASGLRATASGDFSVAGVRVAPSFAVAPLRARPQVDAALGSASLFNVLALCVPAVAVGIARRAIDELADLAVGKTPQFASKRLAEWAQCQIELGEAMALVDAARSLLHRHAHVVMARAEAGQRLDAAERVALRLACGQAARFAADAVDRCYHGGGGSSVFLEHPLQRCFRDVHVASQHVMVSPRIFETAGKHRLGFDIDTSAL